MIFSTSYLEAIPSTTTLYKLFFSDQIYFVDNLSYNKRLKLNQIIITENEVFSIPVLKKQTLGNDYQFDSETYWKTKLLKVLAENYKNADYSFLVTSRLKYIFKESTTFKTLVLSFLNFIKKEFELKTEFLFLSDLNIELNDLLIEKKKDIYLVEKRFENYLKSKQNNIDFFNDNKLLKNSIFSMMFKNFPYLEKELKKIA
jgi:hypothetical protein